MQASFEKILREPSRDTVYQKPSDNQVKIALLAFAGMTLGEIRTEAQTDVETVGRALRMVRDAIRAGKAPAEVVQQYPDIVAEQMTYVKPHKAGRASPQLVAKLNAASKGLDKPERGRLAHWVDVVKEKFAPVIVPLSLRKLAEAIERGEPEALKMAAQSFSIIPGSKGTMIAQKFEFGPGGQSQIPAPPPLDASSSPYFEDILRRCRAKLDAGKPALAAGDMPEPEPEEEESEIEA